MNDDLEIWPRLASHLEQWCGTEAPRLAEHGVELKFQRGGETPKPAVWADAEGPARLGNVCLWASGEIDLQVIRREDELLVVNEHRVIKAEDELDELLFMLRTAVSYDEQWDSLLPEPEGSSE